ncbi:acyltransferase domain-containing protein [Streptomyces sp. HC44]|uniref:Acyltransferase domain-containing protein n=2 Tax=Streptomyces scabichelini TaxID=2711217 RepID=A0A6G4VN90_9ACTN|nr:acyltransferase domain-containing protein [Streptomyces scabichelini]
MPGLLPLSARTPQALNAYARAFRDELVRRPDIAPADLLTTTALGRRHLPHRLVVTAPFVEGLDAFLAGAEGALTGTVDQPVSPSFVFSGQGTGGPGMAAALAARFPVVAEVLRECARIYREETGEDDFLDRITGEDGEETGREGHPARTTDGASPEPRRTSQDGHPDRTVGASAPWDTAFAQPALFALQVAQVRLWRSWGVRPASVAGHSVGEYAALCTAGALSMADGMRLLCRRGRLMRDTEPGAMLAVFADRDRVRQLAAEVGQTGQVELAVSNGPEHQVLAGPPDAVAEVHRRLTGKGLTGVLLPVDRAFHSALLDPVLDDLREAIEKTELRPVDVEFVSGLDGVAHPPGWLPDADHLVRQARHTADFHAVLRTLAPADVLLELGPGATMTRLARRAIPGTLCVPTGRSPDDLWPTVARLHCAGVAVDWAALLDGCGGRRIPLPTYPFEHRSYWIGPPPAPTTAVPASEPDGEDDVTDQAVLERVLDLTAQHLGYDRGGLRAGETYVGLGADSLQLIGMLRQLEAEFKVRIAVRELLEEAGSPELTAQLIAKRVERPAPEPRAEVIDVRHGSEAESTAVQHAPVAEAVGVRRTPGAEAADVRHGSDAESTAVRHGSDAESTAVRRAPVAEAVDARRTPAPDPEEPGYATRAEVAELRRQIDLLAETQASLINQLSETVALLNAERAVR